MSELVERRYAGFLRFVDATTGVRVQRGLSVTAPGLRLLRNRSGDFVIVEAEGLEEYSQVFESAPEDPALETLPFDVVVSDSSGQFLSRQLRVRLPRDADPASRENENSVFRPLVSRLFPAPSSTLRSPGWALLRLSVVEEVDEEVVGVPFAHVRVVDVESGEERATGIADNRGEALVAVPGIPTTLFDSGTEEEEEEEEPGGGPPGGGPPGGGPPGGGPPGGGPPGGGPPGGGPPGGGPPAEEDDDPVIVSSVLLDVEIRVDFGLASRDVPNPDNVSGEPVAETVQLELSSGQEIARRIVVERPEP